MTSMRLLLLNVAFYLGLLAAPFKPDLAKSNVTIVFKQLNVPVEAKFKQLNAVIDFNRAQPETSKASVEIAFQASIWATPNTTRKC